MLLEIIKQLLTNSEENVQLLQNADYSIIQNLSEIPKTDETSVTITQVASDILALLNSSAASPSNDTPVPPTNSDAVEFINKLAALVVTRGAEFEIKLMEGKRGHDNFQYVLVLLSFGSPVSNTVL